MADVITPPQTTTKRTRYGPAPAWLERLTEALRRELDDAGLPAKEIVTEPVPFTKLHRVTVVAPGFEHLQISEQQDLVWRIAKTVLSTSESLKISTIYTLTPDQLIDDEPYIPSEAEAATL